MTKLYTEEQLFKVDIEAFRKGQTAGLAAALAAMEYFEEELVKSEISYVQAWATVKKALAGKIKEEGDTDGDDRPLPVLWANADSRSR